MNNSLNYYYKFLFFLLLSVVSLCFFTVSVRAQTYVLPLNNDHDRAMEKITGDRSTRIHTSMKPFFVDDSIKVRIDSLDSIPGSERFTSLVGRKVFREHLIQVRRPDYQLHVDFLPDMWIGKDFKDKKSIWQNTRGAQLELTVGKYVYIYSSYYESQAVFPQYIDRFVRRYHVVPGQAISSQYNGVPEPDSKEFDFPYATGFISYTPNKYLNVQMGHSKNFIGDGYRSMLLSDVSGNYPFLKVNLTLDNVRYMAMWALLNDPSTPQFSYDNGFRKKWGIFHYLDWNISDRVSAGFFDAVIWQDADSTGKRGFDFHYLNPVAFLRPVEYNLGSPDNAMLGITAKYRFLDNATVYGQFAMDDFRLRELFSSKGWWGNKYGAQLGVKGFDLFKVNKLNAMLEYNWATPYAYSSRASLLNYGHYNQPLAHPYGGNFREAVGIANYQYRRFQFRAQAIISEYGVDPSGANYGKDILKSYYSRIGDFGNKIGQGINTKLYYTDLRVGYLLNPSYNLRLETGITFRTESNSLAIDRATVFNIGLRSSFRNLYFDF